MAALVAKETRGRDISGGIVAAILSCTEVLGCALEAAGLFEGDVLFRGEICRICQPHRFVAVDAAAILMKKRKYASALKSIGHKGSLVKETRLLSEHRGSQQTQSDWRIERPSGSSGSSLLDLRNRCKCPLRLQQPAHPARVRTMISPASL